MVLTVVLLFMEPSFSALRTTAGVFHKGQHILWLNVRPELLTPLHPHQKDDDSGHLRQCSFCLNIRSSLC